MGGETDEPGFARLLVCDVGAVDRPDLETVDAVCRISLNARRIGLRTCLRNASPALRELLELAGVDDLVVCED